MGRATYKAEDLRVIAQTHQAPHLLTVNADSQWKTFKELVDYAKKNPGTKYGYPGVGTGPHLLTESLSKFAHLELLGVPFNGEPELISAVLGNHVSIGVMSSVSAKAQADAGKLRILFSYEPPAEFGVDPTIPDFMTFFGKETPFIMSSYLFTSGKTPDEITQVLEQAVKKMTENPEFLPEIRKLYMIPGFVDGKTIMQKILPDKMAKIKVILQEGGFAK
jgi:tripartite-type tricarboxylate transporter receptor subunit TctC